MIADFLLKLLGEEPAAYPDANDKWPAIFGVVSFYFVPYGMIIVFLLPFIFLLLTRKKFTRKRIILATVIGVVLSCLLYLFDEWFLVYGQASLFYDIYGN